MWGFDDGQWAALHEAVGSMMRRPAHGATRRPPLERPGNGFGRAIRPRPLAAWRDMTTIAELRAWDPAELLLAHASEQANEATPAASNGDAAVNV